MTRQSLVRTVKVATPAMIGFIGGAMAMFQPEYFRAFCNGSLL